MATFVKDFMDGISSQLKQLASKQSPLMVARCEEEEEEEIIDPQVILRNECRETEHCAKYRIKLDSCNDRVNSRKKTAETCYEELLDLFHCVDHCASKKLFSKLK